MCEVFYSFFNGFGPHAMETVVSVEVGKGLRPPSHTLTFGLL